MAWMTPLSAATSAATTLALSTITPPAVLMVNCAPCTDLTLPGLIAGAALAPRGREQAGALTAVATAVPFAYLTLAGRERAMARIGQTRSGLIEDALIVAAGVAIVALAVRPKNGL